MLQIAIYRTNRHQSATEWMRMTLYFVLDLPPVVHLHDLPFLMLSLSCGLLPFGSLKVCGVLVCVSGVLGSMLPSLTPLYILMSPPHCSNVPVPSPPCWSHPWTQRQHLLRDVYTSLLREPLLQPLMALTWGVHQPIMEKVGVAKGVGPPSWHP